MYSCDLSFDKAGQFGDTLLMGAGTEINMLIHIHFFGRRAGPATPTYVESD